MCAKKSAVLQGMSRTGQFKRRLGEIAYVVGNGWEKANFMELQYASHEIATGGKGDSSMS